MPVFHHTADVLAMRQPAHRAVVAGREDGTVADDHRADMLAQASRARRGLVRDAHEVLIPTGAHAGADCTALRALAASPDGGCADGSQRLRRFRPLPSALCPPPSAICHLPSALCRPPPPLRPLPSALRPSPPT